MYPHDHLPHVSALADAMDAISGGNAKKRQPKKCNCGEEGDSCDRMRRRGMAALLYAVGHGIFISLSTTRYREEHITDDKSAAGHGCNRIGQRRR
jgi:hypothetical protein